MNECVEAILDFEKKLRNLSYSMCHCCKQVKLDMKVKRNYGITYCDDCFKKKRLGNAEFEFVTWEPEKQSYYRIQYHRIIKHFYLGDNNEI